MEFMIFRILPEVAVREVAASFPRDHLIVKQWLCPALKSFGHPEKTKNLNNKLDVW